MKACFARFGCFNGFTSEKRENTQAIVKGEPGETSGVGEPGELMKAYFARFACFNGFTSEKRKDT
jgi:hypothetical protein